MSFLFFLFMAPFLLLLMTYSLFFFKSNSLCLSCFGLQPQSFSLLSLFFLFFSNSHTFSLFFCLFNSLPFSFGFRLSLQSQSLLFSGCLLFLSQFLSFLLFLLLMTGFFFFSMC